MERKVLIFTNSSEVSEETKNCLVSKLNKSGFEITDVLDEKVELAFCIGGDGTLLSFLNTYDMPQVPIIGINTGSLGFFQEILPEDIDYFLDNYQRGKYSVQTLHTVKASINTSHGEVIQYGLNEIAIKSGNTFPLHLDLSIGGSPIERFSGDGLLVCTPAGSTAYNYSLGGSIVDPRIKMLQVTPIAPLNTTAYRSFTSSILLPYDLRLGIKPNYNKQDTKIEILHDGFSTVYEDIEGINIFFSDKSVHLIRLNNYDFWSKVKSKFL
ncbi:MAG: NAD(+)/NADH kinase [Clostridia bacterium]|nr:NAD(+)/NADH kinase [Clostridia bacterium]